LSRDGILGLLALAGLAAISWWLNQKMDVPPLWLAERQPPDGFYMTEAEITTAGADGLPRYRVIADEIRQHKLGGPTQLSDVRVEYNIYSPNPWLLTSPEATLSADQSLLSLRGGVQVIGESGDHGKTSFATEHLEIDTAKHVAQTTAPVDLAMGPQRISAVGMVAHLLEDRVQLQSEVHGRFLP
jgi:lipopolysaccharide export system protein LptC